LSTSQSESPKKPTDFYRLYHLLTRRERIDVLVLFIISFIAAFFQTFSVASVFPFINVLMDTDSIQSNQYLNFAYRVGGFSDTMSFIKALGIASVAIIVFSSTMTGFASWMKHRFVQYRNYKLSKRLLSVYLSRPYPYFLTKNSSEISKNVLTEVTHLGNNYLFNIFDLVINTLMMGLIVVLLMFVNVTVTGVIIVTFGALYGLMSYLSKAGLRKRGEEIMRLNKERYSATNEALAAIKITKVSHLEDYFIDRYDRAARASAKNNLFARIVADIPNYVLEAITFGGLILSLVILIFKGQNLQTLLPMISLYAFAGYRIIPELGRIFKSITSIHHNTPILRKIYDEIYGVNHAAENDNKEPFSSEDKVSFNSELSFKNIFFRYSNTDVDTINHLNLTIKKKTVIGLAGPTGSGKTTLVDIMLGLLRPQSGHLEIDGRPLSDGDIWHWQNKISYVPQDVILMDDTITRNIAFGCADPEIDHERVAQVAQISAIAEFIETELPKGYSTVVGERGVRLSGGQRQRLGLARALYRNPELLVLDEATSALDGTTEMSVINGIHTMGNIQTIVMIAHRLNTLKTCDQIYLLEKGQIVDCGTYDELIERSKMFRSMAKA
jgi:ATP-binding cassette subfamily C protein